MDATCPKESYPKLNINQLIDGSSYYKTLSFMDTYSGYNQIKIDPMDTPKMTFMSNHGNYSYNTMPFGLKNISVTYQILIYVVLQN